jgi:hypothetical protein
MLSLDEITNRIMELNDKDNCNDPNDSLNGCCDSSNLSKQVLEVEIFHRDIFLDEVLHQLGHKRIALCLLEQVIDLTCLR